MIKIKLRNLILSVIIFVFLMNVAHASTQNLLFTDVNVKVSSKTLRNLSDSTSISESVRPGGKVEFRVGVRNKFTDLQDMTIRDITVKVTIEGIDNGNDLERESRSFDLRANTDSRQIFTFDIPLEVRQDTFNVLIHAEGQDDNSTIQSANMRLKLEVAKDNTLLKIIQKKLMPDSVSCSRNNVQLALTILNIGNNDQDNVAIHLSNSDLGISIDDRIGGLKARPNEPESMFSKMYTLRLPGNVDPGTYPIDLRVTYDFDRKVTEDTATLNVNKCTTTTTTNTQTQATKPSEEDNGVVLIMPKTGTTTTNPSILPGVIVTKEGLLSSDAFAIGIIIAEIAIVVIGVILVVGLFRR